MANFSKTTPGSGGDLDSEFHSLTEYLMTTLKDQELTVLMSQMALACKATSRACAKAGIANLFGMAGDQNSSGDDQKKLDVLSNDIFVNALVKSGERAGGRGRESCGKGSGGKGVGGGCCREDAGLPPPESTPAGGAPGAVRTSEPIFPPELLRWEPRPLVVRGEVSAWHRPTDLLGLLHVKREHPEARLIAGNSEVGVEMKFKGTKCPVLVGITHVPELQVVKEVPGGVEVGATGEGEEVVLTPTGGPHALKLGRGRDCTHLVESYHPHLHYSVPPRARERTHHDVLRHDPAVIRTEERRLHVPLDSGHARSHPNRRSPLGPIITFVSFTHVDLRVEVDVTRG